MMSGESRQQRRARERAHAKASTRPGPTRPPALTVADLRAGLPYGPDLRIRLGSVDDTASCEELFAHIPGGLDNEEDGLAADFRAALGEEATGQTVLMGLSDSEALIHALGTATWHGGVALVSLVYRLSLLLVAEHHSTGKVVGGIYAQPAASFVGQLLERGVAEQLEPGPKGQLRLLTGLVAIAKIKALAVDPGFRGHGIGTELLQLIERIYTQLNYFYAYGQFEPGSGLDRYYASRGYQILPVGHTYDMGIVFGAPIELGAMPTEQMFIRWLQ